MPTPIKKTPQVAKPGMGTSLTDMGKKPSQFQAPAPVRPQGMGPPTPAMAGAVPGVLGQGSMSPPTAGPPQYPQLSEPRPAAQFPASAPIVSQPSAANGYNAAGYPAHSYSQDHVFPSQHGLPPVSYEVNPDSDFMASQGRLPPRGSGATPTINPLPLVPTVSPAGDTHMLLDQGQGSAPPSPAAAAKPKSPQWGDPGTTTHTGPLGGQSTYGPGTGISPMAPLRAANQTITEALGVQPDWMNYSWSPQSGFSHPSGVAPTLPTPRPSPPGDMGSRLTAPPPQAPPPTTGPAQLGGGMQLPAPQPPDQAYRDNDAERARKAALGVSGPEVQGMANAMAGGLAQPSAADQFKPITPPSPNLSASGPPPAPMPTPFMGTNTPQMIEDSRRMYGGRNPGEGRNPGVDPQVQYGPNGQRVPNPAFYQDVPGAPPAAPPPSNYLPRQGADSSPQGPVTAENPQLAGLAAGVNAMRDQNAAIAARPQGPSYIQRQLAEQGIPQRQASGSTPLPFEKGPAPKAIPLGGYAKDQTEFDARMKSENGARAFGGTLPVRGADGKPTFADGPMKDFGMKPSGQFETDANGRTTKKGGYSSMELQAQADAKATFDARRGGLEARKAAYEARNAPGARAMQARDNPTPRQINSQGRAQARSENRRYQQGKLTMGERLAFANPDAASRTALGKAQIDANNQRAGSQDQFRLAQLQQQEQNNIRNNETARANSQDRLQGQYAAGGMTPPAKPGEAPAPAKPATPGDVKLMPKADGYAALKEQHGPEAANRMMNEIHGTNDWNYEQYPNGPTAMTGLIDGMTGGNGYRVPPQAPPPAGSPNRARMGGGMQLPPKGKPRPNSLGEDLVRGRWGAFEH